MHLYNNMRAKLNKFENSPSSEVTKTWTTILTFGKRIRRTIWIPENNLYFQVSETHKVFFHHCRRSSQMDYRLLLMEGIRCNSRKLAPRIIRNMSTVVGINKQHCHEENLNTANNMKRQTYKNDFRCRR